MDNLKKTHPLISFTIEKHLTTIVGAWVYYFLSALLPLTFLLITAYSVFGVDIIVDLVSRLPYDFREGALILVNTASRASNGITVFFILSVMISGSAFMRQMFKDGCYIFGYNRKNLGLFNIAKGVSSLVVLFVLFLLSALVLLFEKLIFKFVAFDNKSIFYGVIIAFVFTIVCYFFIVILGKFVCPVRVKKNILFFSSLISLTIIFVGTLLLKVYVNFFANFNLFYGSLAGIVGFLLWIYICMMGLVFGIILSAYFTKNGETLFVYRNLEGEA